MILPLPGVDHPACDLNRWAVAHHEAGHALLTTLAGYRLRYVTVRARGAEGRTVYPTADNEETRIIGTSAFDTASSGTPLLGRSYFTEPT